MYFKPELQSRIIVKFHQALNKSGYVFFGKSESMLSGSRLLIPVNKKRRIFQKASLPSSELPWNGCSVSSRAWNWRDKWNAFRSPNA